MRTAPAPEPDDSRHPDWCTSGPLCKGTHFSDCVSSSATGDPFVDHDHGALFARVDIGIRYTHNNPHADNRAVVMAIVDPNAGYGNEYRHLEIALTPDEADRVADLLVTQSGRAQQPITWISVN